MKHGVQVTKPLYRNGCVINPVETSGDGEVGSAASITAEGYEDEGAKVTIRYGDNSTFHKAVIMSSTKNNRIVFAFFLHKYRKAS